MSCPVFFFFNDPATTEIYTLSLHDALPIFGWLPVSFANVYFVGRPGGKWVLIDAGLPGWAADIFADRKSTRLNSSHTVISYAVFCLKKKKTNRRANEL